MANRVDRRFGSENAARSSEPSSSGPTLEGPSALAPVRSQDTRHELAVVPKPDASPKVTFVFTNFVRVRDRSGRYAQPVEYVVPGGLLYTHY